MADRMTKADLLALFQELFDAHPYLKAITINRPGKKAKTAVRRSNGGFTMVPEIDYHFKSYQPYEIAVAWGANLSWTEDGKKLEKGVKIYDWWIYDSSTKTLSPHWADEDAREQAGQEEETSTK